MRKRTVSAPPVKRGSTPTPQPQPFRLRHAAGCVRGAGRVALAVLTGDTANVLASVAVIRVTKAAALKALQSMRASGATSVLLSDLGGTLCIGATSLVALL